MKYSKISCMHVSWNINQAVEGKEEDRKLYPF